MKYIVFYDERLQLDGERPSDSELNEISKFANILNYDEICKAAPLSCDVLINLHGRYAPATIWTEFMNRLSEGMGYVGIGAGTPLSVPAIRTDKGIQVQQEQTTYHESLGICHGLSISAQRYNKIVANEDCPVLAGNENCFEVGDTVGLIVRFTKTKDIPEDGGGSSGPMDAVIYPLLTGFGKDERPFAAPVVAIDNTKGTFAGGRWIFSNLAMTQRFWASGGVEVIKKLAMFASHGVTEVRVRPNYASYLPGEQPTILVSAEKIGGEPTTAKLHLQITKCGEQVYGKDIEIDLMRECVYRTIPTSFVVEPGLYEICTKIEINHQYSCTQHNGFWGYDRELLETGSDLTCDRDYFFKDGKPMPVIGMTYMQSDVHRKYAYLPNPYIWDKDMAEMKRAGINMIRTGMWTGIRTVAFNDGIVNEEFLRFIDAMFLTAKKHDIPIVFNFFAFTPTAWEGINPYLDPRSIQAQKRFISSVFGRHSGSKGVLWDFINEPSICALHTQWRPQPNRDVFEIQALDCQHFSRQLF